MSDEEIIKQRLLIDGDGTGDDRRLNILLKQFLKWTFAKNESPENNQIVYDRLLAQMAQCAFAAAKTDYTTKMINAELKNYAELSDSIEKSIDMAKDEIEESKRELVLAKQIRRNKMEYDLLAKVIKEQPDRKETTKQINTLKKDLSDLLEKKIKLERKFEKRRNDFTLLMHSIKELQAQLAEDSSSNDSSDSDMEIKDDANNAMLTVKLSDDDDDEPSTSSSSNHKRNADNDAKKGVSMEVDEIKEPLSIDVDALSIDKDDGDAKI